MFFTFFKLHKWYEFAQSVPNIYVQYVLIRTLVIKRVSAHFSEKLQSVADEPDYFLVLLKTGFQFYQRVKTFTMCFHGDRLGWRGEESGDDGLSL